MFFGIKANGGGASIKNSNININIFIGKKKIWHKIFKSGIDIPESKIDKIMKIMVE